MPVISADSHVVRQEVYMGLEEKFGDEAPRVMKTPRTIPSLFRQQGQEALGRNGICRIEVERGSRTN